MSYVWLVVDLKSNTLVDACRTKIIVLRHLQNHVMWSRILKYSVKAYVTGPSTKCYFNTFLFMPIFMHDKIERVNGYEH